MRRAYLKETDITVQKALQIAYTYESTEAQACQMEQDEEGTNVNKVSSKSTKESDDGHTFVFRVTSDDTAEEKVMIEEVPVGMLIDSGANVNLIDGDTFDHIIKIRPNIVLKETNIQPKAYGNIPIPLRGEFFATMSNGSKRVAHKILMELTPESRDIATFSCDSGIYRYKVLVMGIASVAEQGQRLLQQILQKCPNCQNGADDILVWGKDTSEYNSALEKVLQKLKENNLTISQHKSVFHIDEVEFHGFTVSKEGIKPTDEKIEAVKSLDTRKQANPVNVSEMKGPWEVIHVDICGPFPSGDYALGIIDAGSRWPEAFVVKTINTDNVKTLIEGCITTHGIPAVIVSDNGPQFRAKEFAQFYEEWGKNTTK
ncbi:Transposon Tf2-9 polyprotein-like 3 [Homarus americanus]|uniref:Transposon Tf2-9 polyprotein-like 3 n=1 Tax=Homarus americanus TaxID=6706 RepID=A0A8J5N5F8_HOMAM|nr:Transposon Tf2-9 polyprotein-like 3 [Homarus americanus]